MLVDLLGTIEVDTFDPSSKIVVITGLVALAAVGIDVVWRQARNVVTIVHEGGHAVAAVLTGRRLTGIRLHSDTSGLTLSVGKREGPGMIVTAAAGYLAPALVGLAGVILLAYGQITVMLWTAVVILGLMLVMVRNFYGALSLVLLGGVVLGVSLRANSDIQSAFGYGMTWFLLLGSVRPVIEMQRQRRRRPGSNSDADQLGRLTHLPAAMWVGFFFAFTCATAAGGTWLLLVA